MTPSIIHDNIRAVPNGTYDVKVSIGDAAYPGAHTINVNGVSYWDALPLAINEFQQKTLTVDVTDGRITIDQGDAANRSTRINYVEINTQENAAMPIATITATDSDASEQDSDPAEFTISRTGATSSALEVFYTVAGTATAGHYSESLNGSVIIPSGQTSATLEITPIDDALVEGDEGIVLTVAAGAAYSRGNPLSAIATIRDNEAVPDNTVIITATDSDASEQGPDKGTFTITRFGSTASQLAVFYTFGGSTASADDYIEPITSAIFIPAGASSASFNVTPIDDFEAEGDETVTATLYGEGIRIGDPGSATVTIHDDDMGDDIGAPPLAPSGLALESSLLFDGALAHLTWTDNSTDENSFVIETSTTDGDTWSTVTSALQDNTAADAFINFNTTYQFRVYALNQFGRSGYSNIVAARVGRTPTLTSSLLATANYRWVDLSWNRAPNADGYRVYAGPSGIGSSPMLQ